MEGCSMKDAREAVGHDYLYPEYLQRMRRETHVTMDVWMDAQTYAHTYKGVAPMTAKHNVTSIGINQPVN